ncbi:hypothetical protein Pelo_10093 [Pelomyxa schiedti]|nr:hypothetical protein Pelo_10093 [Pelomyxa schiedti]
MDQQRCLLATETLRLTADGDWAHAFSNCMALLCPIIDAAAAAPSGAASVNSTRQNANNGQVLTRLFCGVPGRKPLVTDSLVFVLLRFIFPMSPGLFPPTMVWVRLPAGQIEEVPQVMPRLRHQSAGCCDWESPSGRPCQQQAGVSGPCNPWVLQSHGDWAQD